MNACKHCARSCESLRTPSCVPEEAGPVVAKRKVKGYGKRYPGDPRGELVLIDAGASCEMATFPASWKGVPPALAQPTCIYMAVGTVQGYRLGSIIYIDPKHGATEPVFPWGKYCQRWSLRGDLIPDSEDPTWSTFHPA